MVARAKKEKPKIRVTAKMKEAARNTIKKGKKDEPVFGVEDVFSTEHSSRTKLYKALDWYNAHYDQKQSKKWALEWLAEHPELSQHMERFKAMPFDWYGNKGFFCRMMANGLQLDTKSLHSLENAFRDYLEMVEEVVVDEPPVKKYRGYKIVDDPVWRALVDVEDVLVATKGKASKKETEMVAFANLCENLTPAEIKKAKCTLKKHRQQLVDDVEWAGETALDEQLGNSKRIIKRLIDFYDTWIYALGK